jgi:hypothetical protein
MFLKERLSFGEGVCVLSSPPVSPIRFHGHGRSGENGLAEASNVVSWTCEAEHKGRVLV